MKTRLGVLASAVCLLIHVACEKQTTEAKFLAAQLRFIPAAADTAVVERGIDAVPESDAIQLQWRRQSELTEYRLYRKSREEQDFGRLAVLAERDSLYLDSHEIRLNTRYDYFLIGADAEGEVTQPSDTVHYLLLPKVVNLAQAVRQDTLRFHWQPSPNSLPAAYLLKLFDDGSQRLIWLSVVASYQAVEEDVRFNWDGLSRLPRLHSAVRYRWRVDAVGSTHYSGSESGWQKFTMP
jgi:hypothetical protein